MKIRSFVGIAIAVGLLTSATAASFIAGSTQVLTVLPAGPLVFGGFVGAFSADGSFRIEGQGWPALVGTWKISGSELLLVPTEGADECPGPARYNFEVEEGRFFRRIRGEKSRQHLCDRQRGAREVLPDS